MVRSNPGFLPCFVPQMVILEKRKNADVEGTLPVFGVRAQIVSANSS